jgi:hypothetical protein
MFSGILFSTFAAASIAAAAPALADEHTVASAAAAGKDAPCDVQRCCGGMMMERHGKAPSHGGTEHGKATAPSDHERSQPAAEEEDPFVRNQSWGG